MKGDLSLLGQLINSIDDALTRLEIAKSNGDIVEFNKIKQFILSLQTKIEQESDNIL